MANAGDVLAVSAIVSAVTTPLPLPPPQAAPSTSEIATPHRVARMRAMRRGAERLQPRIIKWRPWLERSNGTAYRVPIAPERLAAHSNNKRAFARSTCADNAATPVWLGSRLSLAPMRTNRLHRRATSAAIGGVARARQTGGRLGIHSASDRSVGTARGPNGRRG